MSKQREPQVGDLFWDNQFGDSLVVTFTKYGLFWGLWASGQTFVCWKAKDFESKQYLGKSKGSLNIIFTVRKDDA
jgi:hypothetical protein